MAIDVVRLRTQTVVTSEIKMDFQADAVKVVTEPDHQPTSLTVSEFVKLVKKGNVIYQSDIFDTVVILITPGARGTLTPLINLLECSPVESAVDNMLNEPETEATD